MPRLACDVEMIGARTLVRVAGELSVATAPRMRAVLLKCLVERPDAVVVDLAAAVVASPAAASVFLAVSRQAAVWPGTPLLIAAPPPVAASFAGFRRLAVFGSVPEALDARPARRLPTVCDALLPVSGAASRARVLAREACDRWELPRLAEPAAFVTGELVTNAMVHAQTMADLRLSLGRRHLLVAVRDGSTAEPRHAAGPALDPAAPRGLLMVAAMATRWGSVPLPDGKVVWAAMRMS